MKTADGWTLTISEGRVPRAPDFGGAVGDSQSSSLRNDTVFNELALKLFKLQFKHNAAYRKICEARGLTPKVVEHWTQIPAVPTAAFKEMELTCLAPSERAAVFYSSGTTKQKPSRHYHSAESLKIYKASLWPWFEQNIFANSEFRIQNSELLILTPPPEQAPHSSLVHMFETIRQKLSAKDFTSRMMHDKSSHADVGAQFGVPPSGGRVNAELQTEVIRPPATFFGAIGLGDCWTLDFAAVVDALSSHASNLTPRALLLLGTAFSFVHLLDFLTENNLRFRLPPGSCVMETGGYKNHSRTMSKDELHALITERLGISQSHIICEYGMSELSSQAYDHVTRDTWQVTRNGSASCHLSPARLGGASGEARVTRHFCFPPWARVQIISPETNREVADGETGLIRVFDLANVFSVMAIQTEDLGVRHGDGFELLGRAPFAEPRGCSLMMDELLTPTLSPHGGERVTEGRVRG
jgi:hypothetical protein